MEPEEVRAAVQAAEQSAAAASRAAAAAEAALHETTEVLAKVLAQGGTRLDVLDEAVAAMAGLRATLGQVLAKVDSMATVDDVRAGMRVVTTDAADRRHLTVLRMVLLVAWLVIGSGWMTSLHVESCSPGSKAQRVTQAILRPNVTADDLRALARQKVPVWCDVTAPLAAHQPLESWPSPANAVGLAVFGVLAAGSVFVARRRSWEAERPELPPTVPSTP